MIVGLGWTMFHPGPKRATFVAELFSRDRSSLAKISTSGFDMSKFSQTLHRYEPKRSQVLIHARRFNGVPRNVSEIIY